MRLKETYQRTHTAGNMLSNLISEAKRVLDELSDSDDLLHGSVAQQIVVQAGENLAAGKR